MNNSLAVSHRRADVNADISEFSSGKASPKLASSRSSLPTAATSPILRADDRYEPRISFMHEANLRGQPFELEWDVPIDRILKLRPKESSVPTSDATQSFLLSRPFELNGLSCAFRLSRLFKQPAADTGNSERSLENQFLGCHLVVSPSPQPAKPEDSASAVATPGTSVTQSPAVVEPDGSTKFTVPPESDEHDSFAHHAEDIRLIEQHSWERKISLQTEIASVAPEVRYTHPLVGGLNTTALVPRLRRVMEGTVNANNRSIGFSNLIPIRELLRFFIFNEELRPDEESQQPARLSSSPPSRERNETITERLVIFHLSIKLLVSHTWSDCIARHNAAVAVTRPQYGLIGVKNHGSTCYINVLLQALFHISCFRREVMHLTSEGRRKSEAALHLQRVFVDLERSSASVDALALLKAIRINPSIQNDSHEFLSEFFLHRVFKHITDEFSFKVKYVTSCRDVDFSSSSEETLFELSICVGPKYPTLESAIEKEFAKEAISDLYDTGPHYGKQVASRQMFMLTYPRVLFLHSKRFDHFAKKVHATQSFPLHLELNPGHAFTLHSVIVHHGTGVNSGHFTSYVRVSKVERGLQGDPSIPDYQFFHFDDEAVYAVTDEQVFNEVVGVHWMSPSSSAYILIYIDSDAYDELTANFDPTPQSVLDAVQHVEREVPSRRTPPPLPKSPIRKSRDSSPAPTSRAVVQDVSAPTLQPSSTHLAKVSSEPKRKTVPDPSDLPRIMAACRELTAHPLQLVSRPESRKIHLTVWTISGMRSVMRTLGVVHDLLDLRFCVKYLRQEASLQHASAAITKDEVVVADGTDEFLWGSDRGALSLTVTTDTTVSEIRQMLAVLLKTGCVWQHFSVDGEAMAMPALQTGEYELFLVNQRRNGTWRPSRPLFDHVPSATSIPADSAFATATPQRSTFDSLDATNISGTYTVRKRLESAGMKLPELRLMPPDPNGMPGDETTVSDILSMDGIGQISDQCDTIELHVLATSVAPQRTRFFDGDAANPSPTSHYSPTPNTATLMAASSVNNRIPSSFGNRQHHQQNFSASSPLSNVIGERQGRAATTDTDDVCLQGSATSIPATFDTLSAMTSRIPSMQLGSRGLGGVAGAGGGVRSEANSSNAIMLDDVPMVEIPVEPQSSLHCGNSALLVFKAFTQQRLSVMCSFYVPRDWNVGQAICTLLLCGYLDWMPFAKDGFGVHSLHTVFFGQKEFWSEAEHRLQTLITKRLRVYEEVRPERIDVMDDWLHASIGDLELDHGDILIVEILPLPRDHSEMANVIARHADDGYSSSDEDAAAIDGSADAHDQIQCRSGRRLCKAILNSCRQLVVACTLLNPVWARLPLGGTVYLTVDLKSPHVRLEEMIMAKLLQITDRIAIADDGATALLPNAPSPQRGGSESNTESTKRNSLHRGDRERVSWWCPDPNANTANTTSRDSAPKGLIHFRLRTLKHVSADELVDVCNSLRQSGAAAARQTGTTSAPLAIFNTLFPSLCTTLLQWGSLLLVGSPTPSVATHTPLNGTAAPSEADSSATPKTPPRHASSADAPPLFDVTSSMASRHGQAPWKHLSPSGRDAGIEQDHHSRAEANTDATSSGVASIRPQDGLLSSNLGRIFADVKLPHELFTSSLPGCANPLMKQGVVDIVISWLGWCKALPTHRFRLRSVPLGSSAVTVFALAAQHLGFLSGVHVSCIPKEVTALTHGQLQCSHFYPLIHQLLLATVHRGEPPAAGAASGDVTDTPQSSVNPSQTNLGAFGVLLPLASLLMLHAAHDGCTAPPLRSDMLVADLIRVMQCKVMKPFAGGNVPWIEFSLLFMPNTPMDIEERLASHHSEAGGSNNKASMLFGPHSLSLFMDPRRAACMFTVSILRRRAQGDPLGTMFSFSGPPGLIPASDTLDELTVWLEHVYPSSKNKWGKCKLLLEVFVPPSLKDIHSSIRDIPEAIQSKYWLPRDLLEYSQRLLQFTQQQQKQRRGPNIQGARSHARPSPASSNLPENTVPDEVNHKKSSISFLDLHEEDPAEYRQLIQRSVKFHYHLQSKSTCGMNSCEVFDVKKMMLLFPARLLVIEE